MTRDKSKRHLLSWMSSALYVLSVYLRAAVFKKSVFQSIFKDLYFDEAKIISWVHVYLYHLQKGGKGLILRHLYCNSHCLN